MRRHEEEFARLPILAELAVEPDRDRALKLVAGAEAASLPKDSKLGRSYLEQPERHFSIKEAYSGKIGGIDALLVWTGSNVQMINTGGVRASSGSSTGCTYAFGTLPAAVPWAAGWKRPRGVPFDPATQASGGDPAFDQAFLLAADEPAKTLSPGAVDALTSADRGLFVWFVYFDDQFALHTPVSPDADGGCGDAMLRLAVAVAASYDG